MRAGHLGGLAVLVGIATASLAGYARSQEPVGLGTYHALIIANQQYRHLPVLKTPIADATTVADVLRREYGFASVRLLPNATRVQIVNALAGLRATLRESDNLLIYYAGHGYLDREADRGYWLAVDAEPNSPANWVSNADITDALRAMRAKHVLIVADSCYSGTLTRDVAVRSPAAADLTRLAQKRARNVLTSGGLEPVSDVGGSGHSVFGAAFLDALRANTGMTDVTSLFAGLRRQVLLRSEQTPQYGDVRFAGHDGGDFIFARPGARLAAVAPPAAVRPRIEIQEEVGLGTLALSSRVADVDVWLGDQKIGTTRSGGTLIVSNLPAGTHRITARKDGHRPWESDVEVTANQRNDVLIDIAPLGLPAVLKGDDGAEMVLVPAGEFWMGSAPGEIGRAKDECKKAGVAEATCKSLFDREGPRHRVYLDGFYLDRYEVTNALFERFVRATGYRTTAESAGDGWVRDNGQWQAVAGATWRAPDGPGTSAPSDHPVVQVSWHDARAYCGWAGKRLPTEAEWEKAARGTDGRRYPWGEEWDESRVGERKNRRTHAVGSARGASPYGIHDLAGNVWEWVADWLGQDYYQQSPERNPTGPVTGEQRVLRGGSWDDHPINLRSMDRGVAAGPVNRATSAGFRCARGLLP